MDSTTHEYLQTFFLFFSFFNLNFICVTIFQIFCFIFSLHISFLSISTNLYRYSNILLVIYCRPLIPVSMIFLGKVFTVNQFHDNSNMLINNCSIFSIYVCLILETLQFFLMILNSYPTLENKLTNYCTIICSLEKY